MLVEPVMVPVLPKPLRLDPHFHNVPNGKPIDVFSEILSRTLCKWSTVEKEACANHFALQKLENYLHGAAFMIKTVHKSLKKSF